MASIAARVEIGDAQDSGVAKSSPAGTKRNVNAGPTMRRPAAVAIGIGPLIQIRRIPFFSRTVVIVAVDARSSARSSLDLSLIPNSNAAILPRRTETEGLCP